ncbi:radical SAM protein, partial [Streptomyces xiamenensis]
MHSLIASPFLDTHLVLCPGHRGGVKIPALRYQELTDAVRAGRPAPHWLADAAERAWSLDLDLDLGRPAGDTILIRQPSPYGYARASWEINKGCDYDCDHCYLGLKRFEGLPWDGKARLLTVMRDAGVLWL